jgi:LPXTG-motif cell wall-anchored protein
MSVSAIEWADVPSACRRIAALLVVACLGASAPVTTALAQGAGDQQYQDPFGNSGSGSGSSGSGSGSSGSKTKTQTQTTQGGDIQPLSPSPQNAAGSTSGTGSASGSGTASATAAAAAPAGTSATLPNTGLDTRVLLLGGVALLLFGLGLRLRSRPERF